MDLSMILVLLTACLTACQYKKDSNNETQRRAAISHAEESNDATIKVGKGPDAMFLTPDKQKIYIANVEDTTISVINTVHNNVIKTISGARYPWGFSQLGNTNEVAVSTYDRQVVIIDLTSDEIVRQHTFDSHLGGIATSKDGQTIFVIAVDAKKVLKLDAPSLKVLDTYDTGNGPDGIALSASGKTIFVTNTENGTISIIDITTKKERLLNTGGKPELIHSNHDKSRLFISNFVQNKIHVIDSEKGEIIGEIKGLNGPEEAVLSQNEDKLYVVNFNSSKVFAYKMETLEKLNEEYSTGNKPIGIIPLENKLYVTNYGDNSVSVIEIK